MGPGPSQTKGKPHQQPWQVFAARSVPRAGSWWVRPGCDAQGCVCAPCSCAPLPVRGDHQGRRVLRDAPAPAASRRVTARTDPCGAAGSLAWGQDQTPPHTPSHEDWSGHGFSLRRPLCQVLSREPGPAALVPPWVGMGSAPSAGAKHATG